MMRAYNVRVWLSESYWMDTVIYADTWFNAQLMGQGQSPVGQAVFLSEAW